MSVTIKNNVELNQEVSEKNIILSQDRHFFDPELAAQIGVMEAIMVQHFIYWITLNKRKNKNYVDGRTWTYQKISDIAAHFPYLSTKQVERIIKKLVNKYGILKKGNYNKVKFDRTMWYAFENEELFIKTQNREIDFPKSGNGCPEIVAPIPDNKTDNKESISKDIPKKDASKDTVSLFKHFEDKYNEMRKNKNLNPIKVVNTKAQISALNTLLKSHTIEHIKNVIKAALIDEFWCQHVDKPTYLKSKFEKLEHLLKKPKKSDFKKTSSRILSGKEFKEDFQNFKIRKNSEFKE